MVVLDLSLLTWRPRWVFEQEACAFPSEVCVAPFRQGRVWWFRCGFSQICEEDECLHALAEGGPVPASVPWAVFTGFRA
ncbi:hypothetical protein U1Q18_015554 [Sarracenia purpurea var. burkii]